MIISLERGLLYTNRTINNIPWNAVHYYENEIRNGNNIPSFDNETFVKHFNEAVDLHELFITTNQKYVNLLDKDKSHAIAHYLKEKELPKWIQTLSK